MKTSDTDEPLRSGRLVRRDYCRAHCPRKGWNDAKRAECRRATMCAPLAAAINGQAFRPGHRRGTLDSSQHAGAGSAFGVVAGSASVFVVAVWVKDIIEGPQGMNSFQRHEMVIWNEPERIAAANWVLRCLANPRCEGSDQMLHAILERRKNAMRSQNRRG